MIELIPAIDLIDGKCVRLTRGDYDLKTIYNEFLRLGFRRLHIVDLDGAKSKHIVNDDVLKAITQATDLIVDFGGGIKSEDDIKIILLETKAGDKAGQKNAQLFMDELNELNWCGANITYEVLPSDFIETKDKFKDLYTKLIKAFESEAELYADVTFGPKSLPLLIFAAMQFGEKFFDCSIGNVIYLKTEFKNGKVETGMIYSESESDIYYSPTNGIKYPVSRSYIRKIKYLPLLEKNGKK